MYGKYSDVSLQVEELHPCGRPIFLSEDEFKQHQYLYHIIHHTSSRDEVAEIKEDIRPLTLFLNRIIILLLVEEEELQSKISKIRKLS